MDSASAVKGACTLCIVGVLYKNIAFDFCYLKLFSWSIFVVVDVSGGICCLHFRSQAVYEEWQRHCLATSYLCHPCLCVILTSPARLLFLDCFCSGLNNDTLPKAPLLRLRLMYALFCLYFALIRFFGTHEACHLCLENSGFWWSGSVLQKHKSGALCRMARPFTVVTLHDYGRLKLSFVSILPCSRRF